MPTMLPAFGDCGQSVLGRNWTSDIALWLSELAALYKDLHHLMEYMLQEREKRCGQL
jgi:hypothetical protein